MHRVMCLAVRLSSACPPDLAEGQTFKRHASLSTDMPMNLLNTLWFNWPDSWPSNLWGIISGHCFKSPTKTPSPLLLGFRCSRSSLRLLGDSCSWIQQLCRHCVSDKTSPSDKVTISKSLVLGPKSLSVEWGIRFYTAQRMVQMERGVGRGRTVMGCGSGVGSGTRHFSGYSHQERGLMMSQTSLCDTCGSWAGIGQVDTVWGWKPHSLAEKIGWVCAESGLSRSLQAVPSYWRPQGQSLLSGSLSSDP